MKLYIAGPMTGLEDFNRPAFFAAEEKLELAGLDTLNPARREPVIGKTWAEYMREGLADLIQCQGVALLADWHQSKGARLEVHVARELGMRVGSVNEWLELKDD